MFLSLRYFQIFLAVIGHCRCDFWWSYQWMDNWQVWSQGFHTTLCSSFWVGVASHQQCAESRHALCRSRYNGRGLWNDFTGCSGKFFSGGGGTLDFKWQGWSNRRKNQSPKKSLGLQTKPKNIPGPTFNPQKIPCGTSQPLKFPENMKWYIYHNSSFCCEYPKK